METILHIGMPKTGTTSLQRSFANHRSLLLDHGVLYPFMGKLGGVGHAHHFLTPLLAPAKLWGRVKAGLGSDPLAGAQQRWEAVLTQIEQSRPDRMVLSTEGMFDIFPDRGLERFGELLKAVSDRVTVVAYVRDPANYYSSILMERAKRTLTPRPAEPILYKEPVEQFRRVIGADATVRVFQRDLLHNGDITADFLHTVLGLDLDFGRETRGNVSMRPEAAAVFQQYMHAKTGAPAWKYGPDERPSVEALIRIGREIGGPPTGLRPDVADQITYSSTDLIWLRDEFGISFDGIDYDRLATTPASSAIAVNSLRDAYDFDEEIYAEIAARAKSELPQSAETITDAVG